MDLETLKATWRKKDDYDGSLSRDLWNRRADRFGKKEIPAVGNDEFLNLIADRVSLDAASTALDVGCGAGVYTLGLARVIQKAVGCDIADRMIGIAEQKARELGIPNAEFLCIDWENADVDRLGFRRGFDIVFAHNTPAVSDYATLDSMADCARKHCFLQKPTRRRDEVLDQTMDMLGLRKKGRDSDTMTENTFCYLWHKGFEPQFKYRKTVWEEDKSVEEAFQWSVGWAKMQREITEKEEREIRGLLEEISRDGLVHERAESTILTIDWAV